MKKLVLLLGLMVFTASQALAICDYSCMCPTKAYDISSKGGQIVSNVTGMTFISEKVADMIIKKELKKATKENFKTEIKSYSANDLAHGRFKSLKISGKNLNIDGTYLTSLDAKTLCDFNYIDLSKKTIKFKENMVMSFSMQISDSDLRKTINSTGYLDMLNKINLSGFGVTFFKLSGADVQVKNDKIYFTIKVTTPMSSTPLPIIISYSMKVEDGRIELTKVALVNIYSVFDLSKATSILNLLNPLTFSTDILNNKVSKISIQNVDIKGDKICLNGQIFIPKNAVNK